MQIFLFFSILIAVVAVVFAVQNTAPASVNFLVWGYNAPLAVILLAALAAGFLVSLFASLPAMFRNKLVMRSQRKKIQELELNLQSALARLEEAKPKPPALAPGAESGAEDAETAQAAKTGRTLYQG